MPQGDVSVLSLESGGARLTLLLTEDPRRRQRAMAHGAGHALSHLQRRVEPQLQPLLAGMAHAFAASPGDVPTATAIARLQESLGEAATLTFRRVLPSGQPLPRWPADLRTHPGLARPWPFDPERAALRAGLRKVIKLERRSPAEAREAAASLTTDGLHVRSPDASNPDGRWVVFGAADHQALRDAVEAEQRIDARASDVDDAIARMGELLGYPACCVETFVRYGPTDDRLLLADLLPPAGAVASPLSLWISSPLALVSHAPCSLGCAGTLHLARGIRAALDSEHPGFSEAWSPLATRLHAIDTEGRCLAFALAGSRISSAQELTGTFDANTGWAQRRRDLEGTGVRLENGWLEGEGWKAALSADHRGEEASASA